MCEKINFPKGNFNRLCTYVYMHLASAVGEVRAVEWVDKIVISKCESSSGGNSMRLLLARPSRSATNDDSLPSLYISQTNQFLGDKSSCS